MSHTCGYSAASFSKSDSNIFAAVDQWAENQPTMRSGLPTFSDSYSSIVLTVYEGKDV